MKHDEAAKDDILSDYLTEKQFAAQLKRTTRTLRHWAAMREGPPRTRIGKAIYYRRDSVAKWLADCEQAAA